MFGELKSTYRRHGLWRALPYLGARLIKRMMVFDITHLMVADAGRLDPDLTDTRVDCRFLTADEVRRFAADPLNEIDPAIASRLDTGLDYCYAGLIEGQLASYCWLARHSIEAHHNRDSDSPLAGIALSYPDDYCFRYKGYTHPDFRGQRLYETVANRASLAMLELGMPYILSTAEWINYSAIKSSYRSGYQYLGILGVMAIAGRRIVVKPKLALKDIFFDTDADVLDRSLLSPEDGTLTPVCQPV